MDIKKLQELVDRENEGIEVTIYDKSGSAYKATDGSDVTVTVVGSESKAYRDAQRRQQRKLIKRARVRGSEISPEELESDAIELAASAIVKWHGWESGGKPLAFTPENAKAILSVQHIFDQVNGAIQGHAAFFERSSGN